MENSEKLAVTIVVGMRNSASTIVTCLEGLTAQEYPISEIVVFDNVSSDNSVALAEKFAATSAVPLRIVKQSVNQGIGNSYNSGAAMASTPLLVVVHSDSSLPTPHELEHLTAPLCADPSVVASFPKLLMPREVWERFPYWQKFLFARALEVEDPSMCGKFDCIRLAAYRQINGFDTQHFTATCGYGGEDANFAWRLSKVGPIVASAARVIHLHDLSSAYGLKALFGTRKLLARTYGKILQFQGMSETAGSHLFFVRPILALLPLLPYLALPGVVLQLLFSLAHSRKLYTSRSTLFNPRILLVPLVDIALIYYETYWFFEGWITKCAQSNASLVDVG